MPGGVAHRGQVRGPGQVGVGHGDLGDAQRRAGGSTPASTAPFRPRPGSQTTRAPRVAGPLGHVVVVAHHGHGQRMGGRRAPGRPWPGPARPARARSGPGARRRLAWSNALTGTRTARGPMRDAVSRPRDRWGGGCHRASVGGRLRRPAGPGGRPASAAPPVGLVLECADDPVECRATTGQRPHVEALARVRVLLLGPRAAPTRRSTGRWPTTCVDLLVVDRMLVPARRRHDPGPRWPRPPTSPSTTARRFWRALGFLDVGDDDAGLHRHGHRGRPAVPVHGGHGPGRHRHRRADGPGHRVVDGPDRRGRGRAGLHARS